MDGRRASTEFGIDVFGPLAMKERLPKNVYDHLMSVIEGSQRLDESNSGVIASVMKEWAISKGANHFAHWFHPRTEMTAEKHMAFLTVDKDGFPLDAFTGRELIQGEPDASSFPSGGVRSTFEARGYTAWDPTSPAFVILTDTGGTLCIPSIFISYDGTPLDMKTPLLRGLTALESRAVRLLRLFGNRGIRHVRVTVGAEQEFFLIDEEKAKKRPDIQFCGHTLQGELPPKGQQMEDHYFGSIPSRVLSYMEDAERELAHLGIAVKTRHNEVAPCQFEFAVQFSEANLACDQNQIVMMIMRKVASRHGFRLLLHEKPFSGINGSGKHVNISLMDGDGRNLLEPSNNQKKNIQFLTFLMALVWGISKFGGLLRASIATPGNIYRLGGNEAPPVIMSVFLGDVLTTVLDQLDKGLPDEIPYRSLMDLGLDRLPSIKTDNTDRNRTAPLAFTGNKFEFRAPGASQAIAGPVTNLAAIWAWGLDQMAACIEARVGSDVDVADAAIDAIRIAARETRNVRFEGNCYSPEWEEEAHRRGLPFAKTVPEALSYLLIPENRELFATLGILSDKDLLAYHDTRLEQYVKTLEIEMGILESMTWEGILPAISKQILQESETLAALSSFSDDSGEDFSCLKSYLSELALLKSSLMRAVKQLSELRGKIGEEPHFEEKGRLVTEEGLQQMQALRNLCDRAEHLISKEFWPYPRFRELLTID